MPLIEQELPTLPDDLNVFLVCSGVRVDQSSVFCLVFCRSLFVLLSFFFWSLYKYSLSFIFFFYFWPSYNLLLLTTFDYQCGYLPVFLTTMKKNIKINDYNIRTQVVLVSNIVNNKSNIHLLVISYILPRMIHC